MIQPQTYDLVIVGAGPGGVTAAEAAALRGQSVALVNGGRLMGYGLEGAYKSKSMYEIARAHHAIHHRWDLALEGYTINFQAIHKSNQASTQDLRDVHFDKLRRLGVDLIQGRGHFVDSETVSVGVRLLQGKRFIVATGTRPRILPGIEPVPGKIFTSDDIVDINKPIGSMLVLGAGVIGCEFASIFAAFGTKVTLLDTKDRIFSHDDADIGALLHKKLEELDIKIYHSSRSKEMVVRDDKVHTLLANGEEIVTDTALLAVGRVCNTAGIGLEEIGLKLDKYGALPTSPCMQTNIPHIYAVGDVGQRACEYDLCLVHVAEAEGRTAVSHMFDADAELSTDYVPFLIFTLPMVAGAGLTEQEAKARYGDGVRVGKWAHVRNHRAHAMQCPQGFVKLIVAPEGNDNVLGVRAIGDGVDTVVGEVSVMIQHKLPYTHLLDTTQPHPCLSESLKGAAMMIAGTASPYIENEEYANAIKIVPITQH